jgi:hypothetical protein
MTNTQSDIRLKENIRDTEFGLENLLKIRVVDFNFKRDPSVDLTSFIAQEMNDAFPRAVRVGGIDPVLKPWMINNDKLIPLIVKALQELHDEVIALKKQIKREHIWD